MRSLTELPGPRGLPLIGNLLQLDLKQLHRVLERWCNEFGPLYAFKLGRKPVVVVGDPELIQNILRQRPNLYRRLGTIESAFKEMGITGVFSAEGDDWKRQRRLTAHALDAGHLRQFFPALIKVTERLKNRWGPAADKPAAAEVQQDLMRYTVDVTTNLGFGCCLHARKRQRRMSVSLRRCAENVRSEARRRGSRQGGCGGSSGRARRRRAMVVDRSRLAIGQRPGTGSTR